MVHALIFFNAQLFSHAFGQRYELPIPLVLFVLGGAAIVLASFLLIASRVVKKSTATREGDQTHIRNLSLIPTFISFIAFAAFVATGLFGSQTVAENIVPTLFWLIIWIAVPLSCGLIGDWTQSLNPISNIAKLADNAWLRRKVLTRTEPLRWPSWLGWWPAVLLFFVIACGELVFNLTATLPAVTAGVLLGYFILSSFLGFLYGQAWLERGEVFTVLFATWGRLGFYRFGARGERGLAKGLVVPFEASISRTAFVLLLLVSVGFDGLTATPAWSNFQHSLPSGISAGTGAYLALATGIFAGLAIVMWCAFLLFAEAVKRIGKHSGNNITALAGLLPSLLPISFGYLLAHNIQYVVVNSQLLFPLIGNPVGRESWPIHLPYPFSDVFEPNIHIFSSSFYWYFSVVVIIVVHIIAVIIAHRHLGSTSKQKQEVAVARRSEYPWILAMVVYTMFSLWLLAQPLVKEKTGDSTSFIKTRPPVSLDNYNLT
ncbi:MAG TPA: hypothetical protein VNX65_03190 [Patescibacteria group bacterium]|jgi:hypothetical protein|nr:hypothetical protein [Patescibacteria group bacterium]